MKKFTKKIRIIKLLIKLFFHYLDTITDIFLIDKVSEVIKENKIKINWELLRLFLIFYLVTERFFTYKFLNKI